VSVVRSAKRQRSEGGNLKSLVSCPDCEHKLSLTAKLCPNCGRVTVEQREPLYGALASIRNTELSAYSTRYNVQAALNSGFAAIFLAAVTRTDSISLRAAELLACIGIVLGAIWLGFAVQGKKMFVDGWDQWMAEYESRLLRTQGHSLFWGFNERKALSPIHPGKATSGKISAFLTRFVRESIRRWFAWENLNLLERGLPILFVLCWIAFLVYAFSGGKPLSTPLPFRID
jgi:hypothetical protein